MSKIILFKEYSFSHLDKFFVIMPVASKHFDAGEKRATSELS
jgi:hypothetical protein